MGSKIKQFLVTLKQKPEYTKFIISAIDECEATDKSYDILAIWYGPDYVIDKIEEASHE